MGEPFLHLPAQLAGHHLAAEDKLFGVGQQRFVKLRRLQADLPQGRGGHPEVNPRFPQRFKERRGVVEGLLVHGVERHAMAETIVEGADRDIEGIGDLIEKNAAVLLQRQQRRHALQKGSDVARGDLHALGLTRGAGGEEHIGHVLRPHPCLRGGRGGSFKNGSKLRLVQHHRSVKPQAAEIHHHLGLHLG